MRNGTALPTQVCISLHPAGSEAGGAGGRQLPSGGHHHGGGLHAVSKSAAADPKAFTVGGVLRVLCLTHVPRLASPGHTLALAGWPASLPWGLPGIGILLSTDVLDTLYHLPGGKNKPNRNCMLGGCLVNEEGLLPPPHPPSTPLAPLPPLTPLPPHPRWAGGSTE